MSLPVLAVAQVATAIGDASAKASELLRDSSYQRALPKLEVPEPSVLHLGPLATVLRVLAWAGVAVLAILAVTWVVRRLGGRAEEVEVEEADRRPAAPHLPAVNAEGLAAQGRFAEAIHALLIDTLGALSRASHLSPALTSREIVGEVRLAPAASAALGDLVEAVEVTWFGGAIPGEADYRRCLDRFEALRDSLRSAG